jgi:hypothetical protein
MQDSLVNHGTAIAARFAHAIAAHDRETLRGLLAADVELRALTPSQAWEVHTADDAVETMLGKWFGGERRIDLVENVETDTIADVVRVGYRFRASTPDGPAVVEQQAYLTLTDDAITSMRIICSGYHAVDD